MGTYHFLLFVIVILFQAYKSLLVISINIFAIFVLFYDINHDPFLHFKDISAN